MSIQLWRSVGLFLGFGFIPAGLSLLTASTPCERPIVIVSDAPGVEFTWAEEGSDDFQRCKQGLTDFEYECGPDDDQAEGTFIIRAAWGDGTTEDLEVWIENDESCTANETISFEPGDTDVSGVP